MAPMVVEDGNLAGATVYHQGPGMIFSYGRLIHCASPMKDAGKTKASVSYSIVLFIFAVTSAVGAAEVGGAVRRVITHTPVFLPWILINVIPTNDGVLEGAGRHVGDRVIQIAFLWGPINFKRIHAKSIRANLGMHLSCLSGHLLVGCGGALRRAVRPRLVACHCASCSESQGRNTISEKLHRLTREPICFECPHLAVSKHGISRVVA